MAVYVAIFLLIFFVIVVILIGLGLFLGTTLAACECGFGNLFVGPEHISAKNPSKVRLFGE